MEKFNEKFEPEWLSSPDGLGADAIQWAENFAKFLVQPIGKEEIKDGKKKTIIVKSSLSIGQLRKFFAALKQIESKILNGQFEEKNLNELRLIKPKLAYAKGREYDKDKKKYKTKIEDFHDTVVAIFDEGFPKQGLSLEKLENNFRNFSQLMECLVAYHKAKEAELEYEKATQK